MSTIVYDENGLRKINETSANRGVFAGKVASDGTGTALPLGWSSDYNVTTALRYVVTHNRGYADGDAYSVVVTALTSAAHASAQVQSQDANSFTVIIFDDENNGTTAAFNFILAEI